MDSTQKGQDGVAKPLQSCFPYLEGSPLDKHMPLAPLANLLSLRGSIEVCRQNKTQVNQERCTKLERETRMVGEWITWIIRVSLKHPAFPCNTYRFSSVTMLVLLNH